MFKSGKFVAEHISPRLGGELKDNQVQPNGVDLTVHHVYETDGIGIIGDNSKHLPNRNELKPHPTHRMNLDEDVQTKLDQFNGLDHYYDLYPDKNYIVKYGEKIAIPEGHVGLVLPRSTVMRSNGMINTALWDSGYEGIGEGRLQVSNRIMLERHARIAQIVFADADSYGEYDGQYQGERL